MLYIIERRTQMGRLDFKGPQPERVFGRGAITGLTEDQIAKTVYRLAPDAVLTGQNIPLWAAFVDPAFIVRAKTWA